MNRRVAICLLVAAAGFAPATSALAQVQNSARQPYTVSAPVNDLVRVDNTIYVAGQTNMVGAGVNDQVERFITFDPITRTPINIDMPTPEDGTTNAAIDDGAGGYYVAGSFSRVGNVNRPSLAHITPTAVDTTFTPNVNGIVNALLKQGTTLYFAGGFTQVNGQARGGGAAIDLSTGALLPWNPQLDAAVGGLAAFVLRLSGSTMFIGGNFTTAAAVAHPGFVAVDATTGAVAGAPTTALNTGASVTAMLLSGTTLYLGGTFTAVGASSRTNLAAIDITSGAVLPFQATPNGNVRSLALDGALLYVGGGFSQMSGTARGGLARLDAATGALDALTADANGAVTALLHTGTRLYIGGNFTMVAGQPRAGVAELTVATGALTSLNVGLGGGGVFVLTTTSAGLAIGGGFTYISAASRPGIAAIDMVTNELLPLSVIVDGAVQAVAVQGSTLYFGGTFTRVNGQNRLNFAAVNRHTGELLPWNPNASGSVGGGIFGGRAIAPAGATVFIGGFFLSAGGQSRAALAQVDATTGAATSFVSNVGGGGVNRLLLNGTTLYAGGTFTIAGGQARPQLAAFDLSGPAPALTSLTVTLSGATPNILSMKTVGSTLYLTGAFSAVNGQSRGGVAAVSLPGGAVTAFNPGANNLVRDIDILGTTAYLAGGFTTMNGQSRFNYAAVDLATGHTTLPFTPDNPAGVGNRLLAYPEGLIAGGNVFLGALQFFPAAMGGLPGRPTPPTVFLFPQGLILSWNPPAVGGDITGYQIEVGTGPGLSNIGTVPTPAGQEYFGYDGAVPPGLYYTRVRAVSAAGVGPASPDVAFSAGAAGCFGMGTTPSLSATTSGSNVTITWPDPLLFGDQTYTITAGSTSGTTNLGSASLGGAHGFAGAVPAGAYFLRLQGQSACGVAAPSSELLLSVGGVVPLEAPQLSAQVASGTLTVSWTAVAGATGYRLEAGSGPLATNLAQLPLGVTTASAPAPPPGTYYIRVVALGGPTGESHTSNEVVLLVP